MNEDRSGLEEKRGKEERMRIVRRGGRWEGRITEERRVQYKI